MPEPTFDSTSRARLRSIGRALREARGELSQEELGRRLGVPQTTVSRWERGTIDFGVEQLRMIETALGLEQGHLVLAGGYIPGEEIPEDVVRHILARDLDDALRMVEAASTFHLGVRVTNRWVLAGRGAEKDLEWTVVVSRDAPGLED